MHTARFCLSALFFVALLGACTHSRYKDPPIENVRPDANQAASGRSIVFGRIEAMENLVSDPEPDNPGNPGDGNPGHAPDTAIEPKYFVIPFPPIYFIADIDFWIRRETDKVTRYHHLENKNGYFFLELEPGDYSISGMRIFTQGAFLLVGGSRNLNIPVKGSFSALSDQVAYLGTLHIERDPDRQARYRLVPFRGLRGNVPLRRHVIDEFDAAVAILRQRYPGIQNVPEKRLMRIE